MYLSRYLADAELNPIASREVAEAPCQQNVVSGDIDLYKTISLTQQTRDDASYVITGGLALVRDPETGAFNGSYGWESKESTFLRSRQQPGWARRMRTAIPTPAAPRGGAASNIRPADSPFGTSGFPP